MNVMRQARKNNSHLHQSTSLYTGIVRTIYALILGVDKINTKSTYYLRIDFRAGSHENKKIPLIFFPREKNAGFAKSLGHTKQ